MKSLATNVLRFLFPFTSGGRRAFCLAFGLIPPSSIILANLFWFMKAYVLFRLVQHPLVTCVVDLEVSEASTSIPKMVSLLDLLHPNSSPGLHPSDRTFRGLSFIAIMADVRPLCACLVLFLPVPPSLPQDPGRFCINKRPHEKYIMVLSPCVQRRKKKKRGKQMACCVYERRTPYLIHNLRALFTYRLVHRYHQARRYYFNLLNVSKHAYI